MLQLLRSHKRGRLASVIVNGWIIPTVRDPRSETNYRNLRVEEEFVYLVFLARTGL